MLNSVSRETESDATVAPNVGKFLVILFLLTLPFVNPWVRGDGVGYYAYLRSALIDHDLRFDNDWLAGNPSFIMSRVDAQGHLLSSEYTPTGYVENHFSVGPSMLWAPVVVPVHLVVLLLDRFGAAIPADGYSKPYILSMALTTALYGFLSLWMSFQIARKYFEQQWALLATIGIWLASSLPVYMYFNPSWSHAHSAFAVALFVWYWDRTLGHRSVRQWALLGCIAGLMGDVYYPNILLLIFPAIEIVYFMRWGRDAEEPKVGIGGLAQRLAVFAAVCGVVLLPSLITRKIIYGNFFATGYPGVSTWNWSSPALWNVLFSSDHGLWSWTPILFFAVVGLIFLLWRNRLLGAGSILVVLVYYYFIASYPDWDGLSSFGNRFFVSLTPIFVLGLTALLSAFGAWVRQPRTASRIAVTAIVTLILWNGGLMFQWGTHLVPARGKVSLREMYRNQFAVVPVRFTNTLGTYLWRRQDLMQHIEREDIEQQKTQHSLRDE